MYMVANTVINVMLLLAHLYSCTLQDKRLFICALRTSSEFYLMHAVKVMGANAESMVRFMPPSLYPQTRGPNPIQQGTKWIESCYGTCAAEKKFLSLAEYRNMIHLLYALCTSY